MEPLASPRVLTGHLGDAIRREPRRVPERRQQLAAANMIKAIGDYGRELRAHGLWLTPELAELVGSEVQHWVEW